MKKKLARIIVHTIFPARRNLNKYLKKISSKFIEAEILEFGSGDKKLSVTANKIFIKAKSFKQTDVNPQFGHDKLDIRDVSDLNKKYDLVLCCNVIEHVFENKDIPSNLKNLVKKKWIFISFGSIYLPSP